jgi:hydrogenase maturation protein HypF
LKLSGTNTISAKRITIKGLVQGVGFRPFVYRLTDKYNLHGFVQNTSTGVSIHIQGDNGNILKFISDLSKYAPPASDIHDLEIMETSVSDDKQFRIKSSEMNSNGITNICPDIAVCDQCLDEMRMQHHRYHYPFINCTQCGPRFTIIRNLPYDRDMTSMSEFTMCGQCYTEYHDIQNRRYHAQPTACNNCGPSYAYARNGKVVKEIQEIITCIANDLNAGYIIAVKGLGGYNLMCDANNPESIHQLRKVKLRDSKPFAVMFPDLEELDYYADIQQSEKDELLSWRRPIVIVKSKGLLPPKVSNGFHTIGAMLPYLPMHYLLFKHIRSPLICTSGNLSDEPIITDDAKAFETFGRFGAGILSNNRRIVNRTDDSVVKIVSNNTRIIRRSRGYVPEPIYTNKKLPEIFGTGAELMSHFAISKDTMVIPGQYIGDLQNAETLEFYQEAYHRYCDMYNFHPQVVAHDLHPDYLSTRFADDMKLEKVEVQHHHAHIASCLFENQFTGKAIGICFDGSGLGTDGTIWGSEFFISDLKQSEKLFSFDPVRLPGGDKAVKETWRTALGYLMKTFQNESFFSHLKAFKNIENEKLEMVLQAFHKEINTFKSCGMGRLFDAIAALTGICNQPGFHAEAPMRLENIAHKYESGYYPMEIRDDFISTDTLIENVVKDVENGISPDMISAKFHNSIVRVSFNLAKKIRSQTGINHIALSGGVFQNDYLLGKLEEMLGSNGFKILRHRQLPYNDGNIAVGQIAAASKLITT